MKVQIINKKSKLVELSSDWKRLNSLYNSKIFSGKKLFGSISERASLVMIFEF